MGLYDVEVQTILGLTGWTLFCTAASEDKIDEQKMKDISMKLDPKVGGAHLKRGGSSDHEMREVISDWYQLGGMCYLNREDALAKLVEILEDASVNLRPLALDLRQLISKGEERQTKSNQRTIDSGKQGDFEETVPLNDNQNTGADTSTYQTGNMEVYDTVDTFSTKACNPKN